MYAIGIGQTVSWQDIDGVKREGWKVEGYDISVQQYHLEKDGQHAWVGGCMISEYLMEKSGWLLVEERTGFYFFNMNIFTGHIQLTDKIDDALLFPKRERAEDVARGDAKGRRWIVVPATFTQTVDTAKGLLVMGDKDSTKKGGV